MQYSNLKGMYRYFFLLIFILSALNMSHAAFQAAVITLVFPHGARQYSMGEVGTALADDENCIYWNPAGLGTYNYRWRGGAVTQFYEGLLPALELHNLHHFQIAGVYQLNVPHAMGFGFDINHIQLGQNSMVDEEGRVVARFRSRETVFTLGWGFNLEDFGIENHSFGVNAKYIGSYLAPGIGEGDEGIGRTFAFDIGYLYRFLKFGRFGLTFQNMGPPVFYISREEADPIPFTINAALAFKGGMSLWNTWLFDIAAEIRISRELAKNYPNKQPDPFWKALYTDLEDERGIEEVFYEANINTGAEISFMNTVSYRFGFLIDRLGERFERNHGIGITILDHFEFDFYSIYSPEGYRSEDFDINSHGVRHGQRGFSFSVYNLAQWSHNDFHWWKTRTIRE
ncbi:MAG: PorV/PorQ family protein [Chitinivibrionales bacterium]|nr:PorV/PorQ family protein [Chitinivibrionales bacterium]